MAISLEKIKEQPIQEDNVNNKGDMTTGQRIIAAGALVAGTLTGVSEYSDGHECTQIPLQQDVVIEQVQEESPNVFEEKIGDSLIAHYDLEENTLTVRPINDELLNDPIDNECANELINDENTNEDCNCSEVARVLDAINAGVDTFADIADGIDGDPNDFRSSLIDRYETDFSDDIRSDEVISGDGPDPDDDVYGIDGASYDEETNTLTIEISPEEDN